MHLKSANYCQIVRLYCAQYGFWLVVKNASTLDHRTSAVGCFGRRSVSGQFLDSIQSQAHSCRSTCRQANYCPILVFFVDYFFYFSMLVTASGAQDASFRLPPRHRRSLRGNATPTHPQASPCSPRSDKRPSFPRLHRCRSEGWITFRTSMRWLGLINLTNLC